MKKKYILYTKALSDFGSFMDIIILNVLVYTATGSAVWMAAVMAARTIGGVVASLFSGILADRYNRRKIMIYTDFIRAAIILLLIPFPEPIMVVSVAFLIGLLNTCFMVSFSSEIPQIFGQDKIVETNSLVARLTSISLVVGFIGAGIITELLGTNVTLLIDSLTYIFSGLVLLAVKWEAGTKTSKKVLSGVKNKLTSIWFDMKEVFAYLKVAPLLLMVNTVFLIGAFAGSSHNLGIPLLAESISFERQTFYYGMIWGVWGIGSILATYTLPKLKIVRDDRIYFVYFVAEMFMSVGFITFLSSNILFIIFLFAFITGIFDASFNTLHASILQKADNSIRGRVFGVGMLLKSLGFAVGFIIAPAILEKFSMEVMVWIMHGSFITVTLIIFIMALLFSHKQKLKAAVNVS
ncbi:MFS transporter [Sutcliffiella sp. NC1]|uniref:MFS transporter n=1 Tax=Sutcliffiella sp. NC1 TaxID=3004096 RepID=UPI0022DE7CD6|nr:MFS transporter [Sutcliffiella sp. NC1]WBL17225.1 MFS transporter [Sutcliffiella sp. NC1]